MSKILEKTELRENRYNVETSLSIFTNGYDLSRWVITIKTYDTKDKKHLPEVYDQFSGHLSLNRVVEIFKTEY